LYQKALVGKNDTSTNKDDWVASFRKVNCHPKEDPNVLHDFVVVNAEASSLRLLGDHSIISWYPKKLVERFKEFSSKENEN
jgi:hypothetical protein